MKFLDISNSKKIDQSVQIMKIGRYILGGFLGATLLVLPFAAQSAVTEETMKRAGFTCIPIAETGNDLHCATGPTTKKVLAALAGGGAFPPTIPVLVFTEAGDFLGTELSIRSDLYAGEVCPAEGGEYHDVLIFSPAVTYKGCHHFSE